MQMVSLADSINTCIVELLWMPQLLTLFRLVHFSIVCCNEKIILCLKCIWLL